MVTRKVNISAYKLIVRQKFLHNISNCIKERGSTAPNHTTLLESGFSKNYR